MWSVVSSCVKMSGLGSEISVDSSISFNSSGPFSANFAFSDTRKSMTTTTVKQGVIVVVGGDRMMILNDGDNDMVKM